MTSIEYSPNSRVRCQKCRSTIAAGSIRVCARGAPVSRSSGYINTYSHAGCYTNRKDFTKLYGFYGLRDEDQKGFMTEKQKRERFPGEYASEVMAVAAGATGLQKRDANAAVVEQKQPAKKKAKKQLADVLTIVGLKYAQARAASGEKVTLVREPENQYDSNAINVRNASNRSIGHIKGTDAGPISTIWDKQNAELQAKGQRLMVEGTILDGGNGYQQSVRVEPTEVVSQQVNAAVKQGAAAATAGMTPKGGKKLVTAAVTVSSKKKKGEHTAIVA